MRVVAGDLFLVVGVDDEREGRAVGAGGGLDHVRDVALLVADPLELRPRGLGMGGQVEVAAVRDPLELRPADREEVLEVARAARVVRELVGVVRAYPEMGVAEAEVEVPASALGDPVLVPLDALGGRDEELHLHLLELARPEEEVPRRDLVAEALADLSDPERRLDTQRGGDVLEVDEDALRGLRPEVGERALVAHGPDRRLEHQVERARVGEVALGSLARVLRRPAAARRVGDVIGAIAVLAGAAVDERVGEAADVARGDPDLRVQDDRGVEHHDVVALLHHRALPLGLHVLLEQDAVVAVVVGRAEAAVDVRRGVDEAASAPEGGDLLDRGGALVDLQLSHSLNLP